MSVNYTTVRIRLDNKTQLFKVIADSNKIPVRPLEFVFYLGEEKQTKEHYTR